MIRVVLDTNVVVSAVLVPPGNEAAVLQLCLNGAVQACVSEPILDEYEKVLSRPKFKLEATTVSRIVADLKAVSKMVRPRQKLVGSPDESDNRFLECAEAAKADFLVTGNLRHFPKEWARTRIVNARQLIDLVVM